MRIEGSRIFAKCFIFAVASLALASAQNLSTEVSILLQIKAVLGSSDGDGGALASWTASNRLCAWEGIQWTFLNGTQLDCSSSSLQKNPSLSSDPTIAVLSVQLPGAGLRGSIPSQFVNLTSLAALNLSSNHLTGGVPLDLGDMSSLETLSLSSNELSGAIPTSVWGLCGHLRELQLDHNTFSGDIPAPESSDPCSFLQKLDLNGNFLSGSIPSFIGSFASLTEINLSNNNFSGALPESFSQLNKLTMFDVANNNLSGPIPHVKGASATAFAGNSLLCGAPLTNACEGQGDKAGGEERKGMDKRLVAALVIGAMAIAVVVLAIAVSIGHRHNWGRDGLPGGKLSKEALNADDDIGDGKLVRFQGGEHLNVEEVLNAPGEVLGKTSYGTVYKAKLGGGAMIALRLLREDTVKEKDLFLPAIQRLGLLRYPNIISLLGYYAGPKGEKLLVYNYLSRGSLADLLHNRSVNHSPLSWARRHKIALGAARGLAHLHHGAHFQIIHGNLKSKNIIVDESFEGHLADYALPLLMNTGAQNAMLNAAAAQCYKAPELIKMSRANTTTDIYSFGIVLLEILTGKKPGENDEPDKLAVDLPTTVKSAVIEERISDLFDLEIIAGIRNPLEDGLVQTLQLAMGCCAPSPSVRPDIKEVVRQLEEIRPRIPTPLYTPTGMKSPRDFAS